MAHLILFILATYAAWYVFSTSDMPIWSDVRDFLSQRSATFAKFVYCPICSGFWMSLALSYAIPLVPLSDNFSAMRVVQAFAGAGAIYLIEIRVRRLEER